MANITLRSVKGSPLTNTELDQNFTNLNSEKTDKSLFDLCLGTPISMNQVKTNLGIVDPIPLIIALS